MTQLKFLDCEIKMPLMGLPVRSVVVPTKQGNVLFSPGSQLTEGQLRSVSNVTDIVAPSLLHCGGMEKAHKIFPAARVWGVPKSKEKKPEISWTHELSKTTWDLEEEISMIEVGGLPSLHEHLFIHKASRSLIVTDLVFNLHNKKDLGSKIILNLFGTYDKFAVSRLFMMSVKDKEAFTASMKQLFKNDFDSIIMSHGEAIHSNGKALLKTALEERGILV